VKRALILGGAALALLAGIALLALAAAVHAVPAALAREDAALLNAKPGVAIGPRSAGDRAARALVGAPDRRPYLRALEYYTDAVESAGFQGDSFDDVDTQLRDHGTTELKLGGLLSSLHDPRQRSEAATLLGALILLNSNNGKATGGQQLVQQADGDFQSAIRDDLENSAAKYDLELLLRMHAQSDREQGVKKPDKPDQNARGGQHGTVRGNDY
jgi:hypothetical protein